MKNFYELFPTYLPLIFVRQLNQRTKNNGIIYKKKFKIEISQKDIVESQILICT